MEQTTVSYPADTANVQNGSTLPGRAVPVTTDVNRLKPAAKQTYLRDNRVQIPHVETVGVI